MFRSNLMALYGDAIFVSLLGTPIWPMETNTTIHSQVFKRSREFIA